MDSSDAYSEATMSKTAVRVLGVHGFVIASAFLQGRSIQMISDGDSSL
jgi:hypothetical protein